MKITNYDTEYGKGDNTYQAVGKIAGIKMLVDDFYGFMDTLAEAQVIRAQHPEDLTVSSDKLALFLSGWMGGPKLYQEKYGAISIPGSHCHLPIGESEKDAWMLCMAKAMEKQNYPQDLSDYLLKQFNFPAQRIVATSRASINAKS